MIARPTRDVRIDLLRGLAVLAMMVDHAAGPSPLRSLTGGNQFYTSAAEGFVLLAGLTAGLVSARAVQRGTLAATMWRFLHRAILLYVMVCAITLLFTLGDPLSQLADILTLKQPHHFLDVLVLFAMLFVLAPLAAHLLATGRTWVLMGASIALWSGFQLDPQAFNVPFFVGRAGQFGFPLAAWQLLFCSGMAVGYHRGRIGRTLGRRLRVSLLLLAGCSSIALIILYNHGFGLLPALASVGDLSGLFAKDSQSFGRLIASASVFPLLFALPGALGARARAVLGRALTPLGRHSLLAFALHLAAMFSIAVATDLGFSPTPMANAAIQALTVGFVWVSIRVFTRGPGPPRTQPVRRRFGLVTQISTLLFRG